MRHRNAVGGGVDEQPDDRGERLPKGSHAPSAPTTPSGCASIAAPCPAGHTRSRVLPPQQRCTCRGRFQIGHIGARAIESLEVGILVEGGVVVVIVFGEVGVAAARGGDDAVDAAVRVVVRGCVRGAGRADLCLLVVFSDAVIGAIKDGERCFAGSSCAAGVRRRRRRPRSCDGTTWRVDVPRDAVVVG